MNEQSFITATIPYVNAKPHIGYGLELVQTDVIARYKRLLGRDVCFTYGSDENSLKNVQAADSVGEEVQPFVDKHAKAFADLQQTLNISNDAFIRTTERRHFLSAQKLWNTCNPDDIYKKKYKGLYCVGCEQYYTEAELEDGLCPDHGVAPELVEEENYFFRLSSYQKQLEELFSKGDFSVIPEAKKNEMARFIERGLEDFSISRSKERAHGWGVPVPGDEDQIMYVWFDALTNYLSVLDYGEDGDKFHKYWMQPGAKKREVIHVLGKGVARFHLVYWIGMLLSAGIPLPTEEFVHGYITVEGKKMSKSLGNVLAPDVLIKKYGIDPIRYYLLGSISAYQDGDVSEERIKEIYTAHLANGIGNLTSRIITMIDKYNDGVIPEEDGNIFDIDGYWKKYHQAMNRYAFHDALRVVESLVTACDTTISEQKPWEVANNGGDISKLLHRLAEALRHIGLSLLPFMPDTAQEILRQLRIDHTTLRPLEEESKWGGTKGGAVVDKGSPLFPRL